LGIGFGIKLIVLLIVFTLAVGIFSISSVSAQSAPVCSGNGTEDDGSCVCSEEWSGLQCEVQSSGG